jgi:hypothetical protein
LSPDDAKRLARKVSGLFPDATPAQVGLIERHFESCETAGAEAALDEYSARNERLIPSRLIDMLRDRSAPRSDWRQEAQAQRQARQREDREIDQIFSCISDEELSRQVQGIEKSHPDIFPLLKGKDPRKNEWLRHLIYDRIKSASGT